MPIIRSAKKALRGSLRKKDMSERVTKNMKENVKAVEKAVREKKTDVKALVDKAYSAIDKAAKKGVIKKNTAARKKSRMSRITKAK